MPDVGDADYLLRAFHELGRKMAGPMGSGPLAWSEIVAYAAATGQISSPWEFRALREMSVAFIDGQAIGEDPFGIPPVEQE